MRRQRRDVPRPRRRLPFPRHRGGGPPPHIHRNEDETFYVVEGQVVLDNIDEVAARYVAAAPRYGLEFVD